MTDTIAAIATGLTPSGIGIIRISGPDSYNIIGKIFQSPSSKSPAATTTNASKSPSATTLSSPQESKIPAVVMEKVPAVAVENPAASWKANRIHYGYIVSRETLIDEVLVMNMKAPHSYTGEDTIEINCHGGPLMMKRILQAVLDTDGEVATCGGLYISSMAAGGGHAIEDVGAVTGNGGNTIHVRLAEPGEFTKRAFLNGRIDLAQAESVIDIINASSKNAQQAAVSELRGSVSEEVHALRERLLKKSAFIEAALDDPEHYELNEETRADLREELLEIIGKLEDLIRSYRYGRIIKEGINTCILGKPNAGKSSLLNAMLGEDRAIVTEIPGTTRDVITESLTAGNLTLNIMDTAGIRDTEDRVESIGVKKAFEVAKRSDLCLFVIDSSGAESEEDREIEAFLRENRLRAVKVLNKSDLTYAESLRDSAYGKGKGDSAYSNRKGDSAHGKEYDSTHVGIDSIFVHGKEQGNSDTQFTSSTAGCFDAEVTVSAKTSEGIRELLDTICSMFEEGSVSLNDQVVITRERHVNLLKDTMASVKRSVESIDNELPEDFYTIDLMDAYHSLGLIIGEETEDDLADKIFSEFCMGK